jgi:hypothetical protein
LFVVSLFAATVYTGKWDDDNKWRVYQYGRMRKIHGLAVSIAVFAIIAGLIVLTALLLNVFLPSAAKIELILWGVGLIVTFLVIALESATVEYTKYGDEYVCDQWEYYANEDFKKYVDTYTTSEWQQYAFWPSSIPADQMNLLLQNIRPDFDPVPGIGEHFPVDEELVDDYTVPYRVCKPTPPPEGDLNAASSWFSVPSCVFNWTDLVYSKKIVGGDPCRYHLTDDDAKECIGAWTGSKVQKFWCADYIRAKDYQDWLSEDERGDSDSAKYLGSWERGQLSVDTKSAMYRHCTYLLYMQLMSLIVTCIVLFFVHFYKPGGGGGAPADPAEP